MKDNSFRFRVHFRNLSKFELGMLIYCLELEGDLRHKLGMGKPIGFGTVQITIESLKIIEDPKAQYSDFENPVLKEEKENRAIYIAEFKGKVAELLEKPFDEMLNVQKLSLILDPSCAPAGISYPQGGYKWYMEHRDKALPPL